MTVGFGIENLPYGVVRTASPDPKVVVRLGDDVIDLTAAEIDAKAGIDTDVFARPSLNDFMALGPEAWAAVRQSVRELVESSAARGRRGAAADRGRRLCRLLLLDPPRHEPGEDLPARWRPALAELEAPTSRLSRSVGDGRGLGYERLATAPLRRS